MGILQQKIKEIYKQTVNIKYKKGKRKIKKCRKLKYKKIKNFKIVL